MPADVPGTPRYISYFNNQARLDEQFLHPGGPNATDMLISRLPTIAAGSRVLEIGCGTGGTALKLLERFDLRYIGIDASTLMLRRAQMRLSRHAQRITLLRIDLTTDEIPLEPESVDLVVAESVCAILDTQKIIAHIHRLLKPGGVLAINDRIWSSRATSEDRMKVNKISIALYGFHAAPEIPGDSPGWIGMLHRAGFDVLHSGEIGTNDRTGGPAHKRGGSLLRKLGLLLLSPQALRMKLNDRRIGKEHLHLWQLMENWVFIARKREPAG